MAVSIIAAPVKITPAPLPPTSEANSNLDLRSLHHYWDAAFSSAVAICLPTMASVRDESNDICRGAFRVRVGVGVSIGWLPRTEGRVSERIVAERCSGHLFSYQASGVRAPGVLLVVAACDIV